MKLEIKKYNPKFKSGLINLLQYIWIGLNENQIKERFEWRYEKNPYLKDPLIFIAQLGYEIVGCRAYVVQLFELNKIFYHIFSPCDLIVHPEYQRKGIFSKLNKKSIEFIDNNFHGNGIVLNLSSNILSTSGNIKSGWQEMDALKKYCYKINLFSSFRKKKVKKTDEIICEPITIIRDGYEIEITKDLNANILSQFRHNINDPIWLCNVRNEEFYIWRYSYPINRYSYVYCCKNNMLIAYLIIIEVSNFQSILEEYYSEDRNVLKIMIDSIMMSKGIKLLRAAELTAMEKNILNHCGFISEPLNLLRKLGKVRLPILVRPTKKELVDSDFVIQGYDIRNIDNWMIQHSDYH